MLHTLRYLHVNRAKTKMVTVSAPYQELPTHKRQQETWPEVHSYFPGVGTRGDVLLEQTPTRTLFKYGEMGIIIKAIIVSKDRAAKTDRTKHLYFKVAGKMAES